MFKMKLTTPEIVLFDPKKSEVLMKREGRIAIDNSLLAMQREIIELTPVGVSGDLRSSIQTEIKESGDIISGVVFAGKVYALPLEHGRKASPVSKVGQQSIKRWVEKSTAGQELMADLRSDYPKITSKQIAFLIARKKKKKKTKGIKFFSKGIKNAMPEVRSEFKAIGIKIKRGLLSQA